MADGKAILTEVEGGTQEAQKVPFLCFLCSAFLLAADAVPHDIEALAEAIHEDNRRLVGSFSELLR